MNNATRTVFPFVLGGFAATAGLARAMDRSDVD
jgi:hypothetical protein